MSKQALKRHGGVTRDPPTIIALSRDRMGSVT
eukprot:COSAG01_NODE_78617_length_143_cov_19.318182_1_plen_31_part_10